MPKKEYTNINFALTKKQLQEIEKFSEQFDFKNRTEAMRYLISLGLKYHQGLLRDHSTE